MGGAATLSLIFGAAAFGVVGAASGAVILLLLFFAEVYREADRLEKAYVKAKGALEEAEKSESSVSGLRARNEELEQKVDELKQQSRQPTLGLEEVLESVAMHLSLVDLVKRHRSLESKVADAPVTRLELQEGGKVLVYAVSSKGGEFLASQHMAIVASESEQSFGLGLVVSSTAEGLRAEFDIAELPVELAEELDSQSSFNPHGYVLRLAGLCVKKYGALEDRKLDQLESALRATSEGLTGALIPAARRAAADLLAELEPVPSDGQGDGAFVDEPADAVTTSTLKEANDD